MSNWQSGPIHFADGLSADFAAIDGKVVVGFKTAHGVLLQDVTDTPEHFEAFCHAGLKACMHARRGDRA